MICEKSLRMSSGVGTMSKELVINTIHKFDWVQLGGAIKHPEEGKVIDMNESIRKEVGVEDAYLKIYPVSGYGNQDLLRQLIDIEKPDAILHFTDPRFWGLLYQMEHEIRQNIPILYLNLCDSLPDPMWNAPFYESCDALYAISKQSYGINKRVLEKVGVMVEEL